MYNFMQLKRGRNKRCFVILTTEADNSRYNRLIAVCRNSCIPSITVRSSSQPWVLLKYTCITSNSSVRLDKHVLGLVYPISKAMGIQYSRLGILTEGLKNAALFILFDRSSKVDRLSKPQATQEGICSQHDPYEFKQFIN